MKAPATGGLEDKTNGQKPQMMAKGYPSGNAIAELFEDQLHTDLFNARCHDTGETSNRKSTVEQLS